MGIRTPDLAGSVRRLAVAALAVAVLAVSPSGCDLLAPADVWEARREAFEDHRERWRSEGVHTYRFTSSASCECIPGFVGLVEITVEDDEIVSLTPLQRVEPVPEEQWSGFWTVDGLFELVERALEERAHQFEAEYDDTSGHPTRFSVDFDQQIVDDEFVIRVPELTALMPRRGAPVDGSR